MENVRNMKMPPGGGGAGRLAQVLVVGGAAVYGLTHSIFNVEGGHRCVAVLRGSAGAPSRLECARSRTLAATRTHLATAPPAKPPTAASLTPT